MPYKKRKLIKRKSKKVILPGIKVPNLGFLDTVDSELLGIKKK